MSRGLEVEKEWAQVKKIVGRGQGCPFLFLGIIEEADVSGEPGADKEGVRADPRRPCGSRKSQPDNF